MYPTANDEISVQNIVSPKKCKTGTTMQMGGEEILVQGYKTSRKSRTNDEITLTKRERRILKRLQESKITIRRMAKSLLNLDKLDSDILKSIVENAVKNYKKAPHGKRWQPQNKTYALSIFKRSPKAYRYLQKMLPLPSTRSLQRLLKEIPMEPGIHSKIIQILKEKSVEMEDDEKYCVLFDEIALKKRLIYNESLDKVEGFVDLGTGESMGRNNKIAGHALVFMIQGLKQKFKQPVAHYFVEGTIESEKLAVLIKNIVRAIQEAGFNVLSTVCDQGPTNIGAINLLRKFNGLSTEANYFLIDEQKVFIIFDIPHLFKSIRNNFLQAGIMEYKGKRAKWCHLQEAEERNRNFLNFKKITSTVVNPTYKTKMRVKYAAQALSNTMAAVLKMMAWSDPRSEEIKDTAYIVEEMDKLFDCTNGPKSPEDVKKGIRENVSKKTKHVESWNYYLKYIHTIKFLKSDSQIRLRNVRCIQGLETSLKSLKDIWNFLHRKASFKYLNLRQHNQDSLENLFGNIRQHSITNRNPTCSHFNAALKSSVISGLTGPHSRGSNCEIDYNKLVISHAELTKKSESELMLEATCLNENSDKEEADVCYPMLSLPEEPEIEHVEISFCNFEEQPIVYSDSLLKWSKRMRSSAGRTMVVAASADLDIPSN
ncbi:uncharacterized protein LOC121735658 [Aricia agestis]|uniref:uncharacterized protein LOC121735658 n=1 Tax=Aricia agestis TaxID=91739 RepID=UPI001C207D61|nr:uncharacterized protein LOC121735658 [Aricia agestis]